MGDFYPNTKNNEVTGDLEVKDVLLNKGYTARVEEFVSLLAIQRIDKNRIYGFDFNNEMPATIFILPNMAEGNPGSGFPTVFRDFLLASVQEQRTEKFQIFLGIQKKAHLNVILCCNK